MEVDHVYFLITNYHVLSGRHPDTGDLLGAPAEPDRVLIPLLRRTTGSLSWCPHIQSLRTADGHAWVEHPRLGRRFDVVALPLEVPSHAYVVPYGRDPGPALALPPGSDVAIVGFPEGMTTAGLTAIWKAGSIASEHNLTLSTNDFFWIDSNTRKGMSGAPVIARRFGGALMETGDYAVATGVLDRQLGVYAGRAFDAPDMTLGRVWGWAGVQEIVDRALSLVRRGALIAAPCSIGHYSNPGVAMVKVNVSMSVKLSVRNPAGEISELPVVLADVIKDFMLSDERFGVSLERLRMAAEIAASVDAAMSSNGQMEIEDAHYAILCEVIEKPSKPYNASAARSIIPLLDHVLSAGKGDA